jgi:hypothetical protein
MQRSLILILFMLYRMFLYSQTDSVKQEPYVYFNAVSVIAGFSGSEYQSHDLDHFKRLSPGNSITKTLPAGIEPRSSNGNSGNALLNLGLNIHLKTKDFKTSFTTFSSEWRVGLNIASAITERMTFSQKTENPADTFYSIHTPMVVYETSSNETIYQYKVFSKNVYLDMTKTYHTNQLKPLSFYTGINVGMGYTFNNYMDVVTASDSLYSGRKDGYYNNLERNYGNTTRERTRLGSEIYYNASIPVGVILRLVKKKQQKAFKLSFFAEARFGYRFQKNYTASYSKTPLGTFQIGTKLYFHRQKTH